MSAARWEVYAIDLDTVMETFDGTSAEGQARELADQLDGLALRCYARKVLEPVPPKSDRDWELGQ